MITYTYDEEIRAAYIKIKEASRVGTLQVTGDIRYRKPAALAPLKELVILDFDENQELVGIELIGDRIPLTTKGKSSFQKATLTLILKPGANPEEAALEVENLRNALKCQGIANGDISYMDPPPSLSG
jgi:uncharacterized protein YuzE